MSCPRSASNSGLRMPWPGALVSVAMPSRYLARGVGKLPSVSTTPDVERIERPPQRLWDRIRAEPDRLPEYVALSAADRFGPQAERWVQIAGPGHTPAPLVGADSSETRKPITLAICAGGTHFE